MQQIAAAFTKFRLPIYMIFGPVIILVALIVILNMVQMVTGAPGVFDEPLADATPTQEIGSMILGVFWPVFILASFAAPICIIAGLILLVSRSFKRSHA